MSQAATSTPTSQEELQSPSVLTTYKQLLRAQGYLHLTGLPDNFDHVMFAEQFSPLQPQYDGRFIWSIKADPKFDEHYHSLNTKALNPHTECYEFDGTPPEYLVLYCVKPPADDGGKTQLFDAVDFVGKLDTSVQSYISEREFSFVSSSGIQASSLGKTARHKIYEKRNGGRPILRFSYNCMERNGDQIAEDFSEKMVDQFKTDHKYIRWSKNDFLIWDNFRILHSRDAYQDRTRELKRLWLGTLHS